MSNDAPDHAALYPYPRRRAIRFILRTGIKLALGALCHVRIEGRENLPASGPLIVVSNHFCFLDPVAIIRVTPWPIEFLAGRISVDAPPLVAFLPRVWGVYTVRRGGSSRDAMRAASAVLAQKGVLDIMPEGGSWAQVLRPARPGTAFLAVQTGAPLLPIGLDGWLDIFPSARRGRRATAVARIGRPVGPYQASGHGRERRRQLEEIGHDIMRHIAELIPPERHGVYSADPALRAAAQEAAVYPYDDLMG